MDMGVLGFPQGIGRKLYMKGYISALETLKRKSGFTHMKLKQSHIRQKYNYACLCTHIK